MPRTCWSCRAPAGDEAFCPVCAAIQPPDCQRNLFQVLGLVVAFAVDREMLEARYREAQQRFHPDRFVTRSATERRLSVEHVTRVNEAYQTLRDPLPRARHLLHLAGVAEDTSQDPAWLMTVMESREALSMIDPASRDALARLDRLRQEAQAREQQDITALAHAFEDYPHHPHRLQEAARCVNRLRYQQRFLEEVERMEEEAF